ncbi:hypothetical protein GHT06_015712 [Daphnia sinensis]|uniref:Uncharacterized protein n=1 Tax=Daphnia sinensis TaxID=1820382 RepID=A0AAD5LB03_9CRUS|nr:hypothetical protein GHT06_015712 [Daphnia sinensis]
MSNFNMACDGRDHPTRTHSLEQRVAVWVRTVPASADELKGPPVRDDFLQK